MADLIESISRLEVVAIVLLRLIFLAYFLRAVAEMAFLRTDADPVAVATSRERLLAQFTGFGTAFALTMGWLW